MARQEVHRLHEERDHYEEAMKKAFMRGVCALNLEAMTMFQESEDKTGTAAAGSLQNTPMKYSRIDEYTKITFRSCCMLDCQYCRLYVLD